MIWSDGCRRVVLSGTPRTTRSYKTLTLYFMCNFREKVRNKVTKWIVNIHYNIHKDKVTFNAKSWRLLLHLVNKSREFLLRSIISFSLVLRLVWKSPVMARLGLDYSSFTYYFIVSEVDQKNQDRDRLYYTW